MNTNIHQKAAIVWLLASVFAFAPVLAHSSRPDIGTFLAYGILLTTAIIAIVPLLLRTPAFRSLFCWTDALSAQQRQAITQHDLRGYQAITRKDNYAFRVSPYFRRMGIACLALFVLDAVVPKKAGGIILDILTLFPTIYLMGVMLLILMSVLLVRWPQEGSHFQ